MSIEFSADSTPSEELCREIANLAPANPFYTFEYLESKRAAGVQPWLLLLRENGRLISGCPAFIRADFLTRSLEIESLPTIPNAEVFWNELRRLCRESSISELDVYTTASTSVEIPPLPGEIWRRPRREYVIELQKADLWKRMRNSHRGRVNRSRKAGVTVKCATGAQAWEEHRRAVRASMERRKIRGESFAEIKHTQFFEVLVRNGRGELFQAFLDDKVLSSALVIRAERGAYYLWAGTQSEGMALGASHFLIHEITKRLQEEGLEVFNLGGTNPENKGLIEFKRGFGTIEVNLEAAEFCFGSRVKRRLGRALELLRESPAGFLKRGMDYVARRSSAAQVNKNSSGRSCIP